MTHGSIIGYDINAKMCQISYYNEKTQEPETVDTGIKKENNPGLTEDRQEGCLR